MTQACGEVTYVRMAGDASQQARFAFIEFVEVDGKLNALLCNGALLFDRQIKFVPLLIAVASSRTC